MGRYSLLFADILICLRTFFSAFRRRLVCVCVCIVADRGMFAPHRYGIELNGVYDSTMKNPVAIVLCRTWLSTRYDDGYRWSR